MSDRFDTGAFRYNGTGTWFKGNTHIHTTRSDGGLTPAEAAERYAGAGYDFIFFTDHWVASEEWKSGASYPLPVFDGVELDGTDGSGSRYHVVCLGRFNGVNRDMGFEAGLRHCRESGGLLVLAHPYWMGNSVSDAVAHGFHAVETYNHVCQWLNGKGNAAYVWDAMLGTGADALGIASDDAHMSAAHPGWNGAWIMVRARECSHEAIMRSLFQGRFYSTQGPRIDNITLEGTSVHIDCSPARFARLIGPGSSGRRTGSFDGPLTGHFELELDLDESFPFVRLEIEDDARRTAWTNTLFPESAKQR